MIGFIKRLSVNLPFLGMRYWGFINSLLTSFGLRRHYDKPLNESFKSKIENIQYKVCIVLIGAVQETLQERLYHELGLESLGDQQLCCKLTFFYKIVNGLAPTYLANYLNINDNWVYKRTASEHSNIKRFGTRTENFKHIFSFLC